MRTWPISELSLRRLVWGSVGGCLLAAMVSCSGAERVYPVSGTVLFEGKPAAGAVVKFYAADAADKNAKNVLIPQGVVGTDGSFRLTSYKSEDGAPAGNYRVSVFWAKPSKGGDDFDKLLVPPRYLNPETSGLTAEVAASPTALPPFQLKNKSR